MATYASTSNPFIKLEEGSPRSRGTKKDAPGMAKPEKIDEELTEEDEVGIELEPAPMKRDDRRNQHIELIRKLRLQLKDLEQYAYERGELDQISLDTDTNYSNHPDNNNNNNIQIDDNNSSNNNSNNGNNDNDTNSDDMGMINDRKRDLSKKNGDTGQPIKEQQQQFNDNAAWSLHIDRVILASDSLVNLFTCEPQTNGKSASDKSPSNSIDEALVESIVRRQLVPAIRDLLSYGIIDPNSMPKSNSYVSLLFDPYYILSSLTCFPSSQKSNQPGASAANQTDKIHVWNIIEDYYKSNNEPVFKSSSAKTLSQSFNLAPSISGPIKITSKQALLIAVEDIIETLSNCKPNGPDSHFRSFVYCALNRQKLPTWLRLIFKNKSVNRKYYFNFSFTSQQEKMDKFLTTLDALGKFEFKLRTDVESIEQFISAF